MLYLMFMCNKFYVYLIFFVRSDFTTCYMQHEAAEDVVEAMSTLSVGFIERLALEGFDLYLSKMSLATIVNTSEIF